MPEPGITTPQTERPVRRRTEEAVLPHAFRILVADGANALTPQRLHAESGVARTTIYRNWPTTTALILSLLARATSEERVGEFNGDLEHDLRTAIDSLTFRFNNRPAREFFGALVEFGRGDPTGDGRDLAADFIAGMLAPATRAITDAVERGDLEVADIESAVIGLAGPLLTRHIILGETVSQADGAAAVQRFIDSYQTP